jgi:hypothetical protein
MNRCPQREPLAEVVNDSNLSLNEDVAFLRPSWALAAGTRSATLELRYRFDDIMEALRIRHRNHNRGDMATRYNTGGTVM